jgi:hypothetical protein
MAWTSLQPSMMQGTQQNKVGIKQHPHNIAVLPTFFYVTDKVLVPHFKHGV